MCSPIVIGVVQNLFFVYIVIPTFYHKNFGAPSRDDILNRYEFRRPNSVAPI